MDISYNGLYEPSSNIITFTDIPNILKVEEVVTGEKAEITFSFDGNLRATVTGDNQYTVSVLGETVSNVMSPSNANNKRFFCSGDEDGTAMSFCRALRDCQNLSAEFNIIHTGNEVQLIAKTIGSKGLLSPTAIQHNLPAEHFEVSVSDGGAYSVLFNGKIDIDVYSGASSDVNNYVTTLEKNFYGNECAFDVSPVLSTISDFGKTQPYSFGIQLIREDGEWQNLGFVSGNTTVGYRCNDSYKYLIGEGAHFAHNTNIPITLYTYSNIIDYSVMCGLDTGGWSYRIRAYNSALTEIYDSGSQTAHRTSSNMLIHQHAEVPESAFTQAYYVDVTVGVETQRYNVIKPLKATEYYQRVEWFNEYGGISFFDFTGAKTEANSINSETYEKNIFDYYGDDFELKKVYKNENDITVTLASHLMGEDGKYIFNSLAKSKKVWTYINGVKKYIIPTAVEVTEDSNYNNIFTGKLTYKYSVANI